MSPRLEASASQTLGLSKLPPLPDTPMTPRTQNLSDDDTEGEICIEILQFERYEIIDLTGHEPPESPRDAGPVSPRGWQSAEPSPARPRQ